MLIIKLRSFRYRKIQLEDVRHIDGCKKNAMSWRDFNSVVFEGGDIISKTQISESIGQRERKEYMLWKWWAKCSVEMRNYVPEGKPVYKESHPNLPALIFASLQHQNWQFPFLCFPGDLTSWQAQIKWSSKLWRKYQILYVKIIWSFHLGIFIKLFSQIFPSI